jgi:NAD(P)-dependent dehydrogenase (short-subunit alcohol dehydrogenase family)
MLDLGLTGQRAVTTGGARGIGWAIALPGQWRE